MTPLLSCLITFWSSLCLMTSPGPQSNPLPNADLFQAVEKVNTGVLVFGYPTRDEVRGRGQSLEISMGSHSRRCFYHGYTEEESKLERGPAWVKAKVRHGHVVKLDIRIGDLNPAWECDLNLGMLEAPRVAAFFLQQVPQLGADVADQAMLAAAIAREAELVEPLIEIVKDRRNQEETRQSGLFWLAGLASEKALMPLRGVIEEEDEAMELREAAVFALSQMDRPETLELLLSIASDETTPQLQQAAFFALAEYDNPEVVEFLEDFLINP